MTTPAFVQFFPHSRRFGLELEFFNISDNEVSRLLTKNGIQCWNANYYDSGDGWKITDDGSIIGDYSVELVSPILSGVEGLEEVAKVVQILADAGAKVNKSCGFHVHVDAQDLSSKVLFNVYRRYALHEDQIDSFMVASRRSNNNHYCQSPRNFLDVVAGASESLTAEEAAELMEERYVSGRYVGGRYNKVNLCAYLRHGTIEFRHHSGTMNVQKVLNWVCFCVNFVEVSINSDTANIFTDVHPDSVEFFNRRAAAFA
jgi:hypothetical protein